MKLFSVSKILYVLAIGTVQGLKLHSVAVNREGHNEYGRLQRAVAQARDFFALMFCLPHSPVICETANTFLYC